MLAAAVTNLHLRSPYSGTQQPAPASVRVAQLTYLTQRAAEALDTLLQYNLRATAAAAAMLEQHQHNQHQHGQDKDGLQQHGLQQQGGVHIAETDVNVLLCSQPAACASVAQSCTASEWRGSIPGADHDDWCSASEGDLDALCLHGGDLQLAPCAADVGEWTDTPAAVALAARTSVDAGASGDILVDASLVAAFSPRVAASSAGVNGATCSQPAQEECKVDRVGKQAGLESGGKGSHIVGEVAPRIKLAKRAGKEDSARTLEWQKSNFTVLPASFARPTATQLVVSAYSAVHLITDSGMAPNLFVLSVYRCLIIAP